MKDTVKKINFLLNSKEKKNYIILIFILIAALIFQLIGLITLLPLTNVFFKIENSGNLFVYLEKVRLINNFNELNFYLTITVFTIILSNIIFLISVYLTTKIALSVEKNIRHQLMIRYMNLSYIDFLNTESSTMISIVINETQRFSSQVLMPLGEIVSRLFLIIGISALLFYLKPITTLLVLVFIIFSYTLYYLSLRSKIKKNNYHLTDSNKKLIKHSNDIFSSFREIKIYALEGFFVKSFLDAVEKISSIRFFTVFFSSTPRFYMEILVFICIYFYFLLFGNSENINFGYLSILMYSFFKIIPSLQGFFSNYVVLKSALHSLDTIYNFLVDAEREDQSQILDISDLAKEFKKINLEKINFSFDNKEIFREVNLEILKGDKVALLGPSGSGKSTLVNLIIGILEAKSGNISINDKPVKSKKELTNFFQDKVSIIPQKPTMMEATIKENIILNQSFDEKKFKKVIDICQLNDFLNTLSDRENSYIHSSNLNLSGGQLQRISIARAMYRNPKILLIDEGFNQLDKNVENIVSENILSIKDLTVIIIYHKIISDKLINKKFYIEEKRLILE
ncbi:ABC transporter ATP-binding protein/permease [Candidatus Pelagibacter ubique]|nr:ABC transporter ATP-binding protein/permease [Candidatus Pelagibacter ubique]